MVVQRSDDTAQRRYSGVRVLVEIRCASRTQRWRGRRSRLPCGHAAWRRRCAGTAANRRCDCDDSSTIRVTSQAVGGTRRGLVGRCRLTAVGSHAGTRLLVRGGRQMDQVARGARHVGQRAAKVLRGQKEEVQVASVVRHLEDSLASKANVELEPVRQQREPSVVDEQWIGREPLACCKPEAERTRHRGGR